MLFNDYSPLDIYRITSGHKGFPRSKTKSRESVAVTTYLRYDDERFKTRTSSSSPPGQAPEVTKKRKRKKHACQTSINTHPNRAPEGKTAIRVEIIKSFRPKSSHLSIQWLRETTTAILTDSARGPGYSL